MRKFWSSWSNQNRSANHKIKDLDFPRMATIGGVIRDGRVLALGDYNIMPGDRVVVWRCLVLSNELKVCFIKIRCPSCHKVIIYIIGVLLLFNGGLMLLATIASWLMKDTVTLK